MTTVRYFSDTVSQIISLHYMHGLSKVYMKDKLISRNHAILGTYIHASKVFYHCHFIRLNRHVMRVFLRLLPRNNFSRTIRINSRKQDMAYKGLNGEVP